MNHSIRDFPFTPQKSHFAGSKSDFHPQPLMFVCAQRRTEGGARPTINERRLTASRGNRRWTEASMTKWCEGEKQGAGLEHVRWTRKDKNQSWRKPVPDMTTRKCLTRLMLTRAVLETRLFLWEWQLILRMASDCWWNEDSCSARNGLLIYSFS